MLVAASLFFRAILDFAGVVVFIPVLARVLEKEGDIVSVLPVAGAALAPKFGLQGVWIAMCAELCFRGIIFLIRLYRKKWLK